MLSIFNNVPLKLGAFSGTINPMVSRAATAAAESTNEIYWIIQVDC